ncbi:staphylopine family metallophore export MFS transporter CntE [Paenibacillus gansuensis]|uniref:Staphylopine family metallophore export MFS transporter CntE n=1 Tax=Paenibacillus gansuensis TaxID=306542 RepID=A0ABW5P8M5_9BACL
MKGALSWPFLRLYLLTLLYFSANSILNVIIPLKGDSLGATNTTIGLVMGAYLFTTMILRPWAGMLIQTYGPIRMLRILLVVNGAALLLYTTTGMEGYFAARMLQGACTAFFSMSLQLGIIDALPDKHRSQGISMYSLCATMPGIIGPFLAVGIWQAGDAGYLAFTMISIAVLTGIVGFSTDIDGKKEQPAPGQAQQGVTMVESMGQLVRNPHLFKSSVLMLTASLVFGAVTTFIPLYALETGSGHAALFLMLQAGTVVAARFVLRKKIPSDGRWHSWFMVTIMGFIAAASLLVSFLAMGGTIWFYAGAVLMGLAQALLYPALTTYLSFVLPSSQRNVLMGLFIAMADLGVSLGSIVMGPIADVSSYSLMYTLCAVLGAVMILFAYERRPGLERLKR